VIFESSTFDDFTGWATQDKKLYAKIVELIHDIQRSPFTRRKPMTIIRNFIQKHPQITAWIALAIGMVIILVWSAKDVGFTAGQWAALVVTTILLAGACVWIIGWGEDEEEGEAEKEGEDKEGKEQETAA
jgi:ABC-type sugar transport system substrate-binding protein